MVKAGHDHALRTLRSAHKQSQHTIAPLHVRLLTPGQETEARLKPGTIKHCALQVLKDAGARGMAIDDIMAAVSAQGLRQWDANSKRVVQFVSAFAWHDCTVETSLHAHCSVPLLLVSCRWCASDAWQHRIW